MINIMPPRKLFTDGWNSFFHFIFGVISVKYKIIIILFLLYQFYDYNDVNLFVDIAEFFIGFIISEIVLYFSK